MRGGGAVRGGKEGWKVCRESRWSGRKGIWGVVMELIVVLMEVSDGVVDRSG